MQAKKIQHFNQIQKLDNLSVQSIILSSLRAALPHPEIIQLGKHLMTISPNNFILRRIGSHQMATHQTPISIDGFEPNLLLAPMWTA